MKDAIKVGVVGNPNSGKTTIFNALTGSSQKVGNWPGVTVERKSGFIKTAGASIEVIDLPGTYSLSNNSGSSSIDEKIACDFILGGEADVIINVLDGSNLERNLYLTLQLIEMQVPLILAVNMMDVAQDRGLQVSLEKLSKEFNCVVVALEANKSKGIEELKKAILQNQKIPTNKIVKFFPAITQTIITNMAKLIEHPNPTWVATRLLEDDVYARTLVDKQSVEKISQHQQFIKTTLQEDADILIADARYQYIQTILNKCVSKSTIVKANWTSRLDKIILNRVLGLPIFLLVMYCIFLFSINIGGAFQDFFDISTNTIFVDGFAYLLGLLHAPTWLIALLANGIGKGINTTVTFIPVIGAMFLFLALLEDSGYMARAAFVVDRLMRALGLPGKAFVPMIVGFGCNVPAVMGARTLENQRDRILTIMMTPFMSCGARLAIFAVFTAAFFPRGGQNVVFFLYLTGILVAVLTGFLLRKTILQGDSAPLLIELPPYHVPNLKTLGLNAWQRLKGFVFRAGKLIIPICVLIGALGALNLDGSINGGEGDVNSVLSYLGKLFTPVFAPMGIHDDNWPATVGLLTGVLAKEVVIGSLNALYSQVGHLAASASETFNFFGGLKEAFLSIPTNLLELGNSLSNPVLAKAPVHSLTQPVYGFMAQKFDGKVGAISYLLFVLLYLPCISTTAVIARELSRGWANFSLFWSTFIAYGLAVSFYQLGTFSRHPFSSILWVVGMTLSFVFIVLGMRWYSGWKFPPAKRWVSV